MNKRFTIMVVLLVVMTGRVLADVSIYLNFTAVNGPATISLESIDEPYTISLQYSIDNCNTWTSYTIGQDIQLALGAKVFFKATSTNQNFSKRIPLIKDYYRFEMSGSVAADGNIMSLLDETMQQDSVPRNAFCYLFENCSSLTTAPYLPATQLSSGCYEGMFSGCNSLITAPYLPAITLSENCYQGMFNGCQNLTTVPDLPATTLASYCYGGMFSGCISLSVAPNLSATTLADNCCNAMFFGCKSLIGAPLLPADTMATLCYCSMFGECSSLCIPPALPATTLANSCYYGMFSDCTSLITLPTLSATTLSNSCYHLMFQNCTNLCVNTTSPGKAWQIPSNAVAVDLWNSGMFSGTGGTFTGDPEIGVTYYIASDTTSDTTVTDVVNVIDEANISFYPNPVHIGETIYVSADEDLSMVEVYDVDGLCVQRIEPSERTIEIKGLNSAGVYIVRMMNNNNRVTTRKLIVN